MKIDSIDHLNTASAQRVGVSFLHDSAELHVSGTADYTGDLPELQGTAHIALGLSERAHARLLSVDLDAVRRAPGVIAVLTVADIPAANNCGPILHDNPI